MTLLSLLQPSRKIAASGIFSPPRYVVYFVIVLAFLGRSSDCAFAQFTSMTNILGTPMITSGISVFGHAVSVCDFDGDGLDDISFGTTEQSPRFYRNTGSGFELMGFNLTSPNNSIKSILWADIDNDGDRDLFISYEFASVRLYENDGAMNLTDITASSGILMENNRRNYGAAFGDYNNDGYLDLYLCKYYNTGEVTGPSYQNLLYRNNGNNTFTNVTAAANASVGVNASFMATWFDYNDDGWLDIFVVNDRIYNQNHLLRNNANGTFTEISATVNLNAYINAMSCSLGDFNNDLLTDMYVSNSQDMGNYFYRHQSNHSFQNVAQLAGVEAHELCWSALWMDFDNDGDVDLHVATEQYSAIAPRNLFYVNNGNETFTEQGVSLGLGADNRSTWATAQGDWNMDGYPDFVSHNRAPDHSGLWQNNGGSNAYIAVKLEGVVSNRDAIGSKIFCYANGIQQLKTLQCGENYLGQNSHRILFGLGSAAGVDSVIVQWPSGHIDRYFNLIPNSTYSLLEGSGYHLPLTCDVPSFCQGDSTLLIASGNSIVWSNGLQGTDSIWVATPGLYWYAATNALGLSLPSETVEIQVKELPETHWTLSHPPCANTGGTIGWDGTFPEIYSVILDDEAVSLPLMDIAADSYALEVWSTNGCAQFDTLTLIEPPVLSGTLDFAPILCHGESSSFTVATSGGTGETSIAWGAVNPLEVYAGSYSINVQDENGCIAQLTAELVEPEILSLTVEVNHVVFDNDGSATATIVGGTPPYTVLWTGSGGFTSGELELSSIGAGVYTIQVSDSNGCTAIESVVILPVGSEEHNGTEQPRVYPNPFSDVIHLVNLPQEVAHIALYTMDGRRVISQITHSASQVAFATDHLAAGNYILVISSNQGIWSLHLSNTR
jgi:hypothetical protein